MIPRLKIAYEKEIISKLMGKLSLKNKHEVPKFKKIVGIAMIKKNFCNVNESFQVKLNGNLIKGEICSLPIL